MEGGEDTLRNRVEGRGYSRPGLISAKDLQRRGRVWKPRAELPLGRAVTVGLQAWLLCRLEGKM